VICLAPRAPGDSVRPRRPAGVVTRPLNFTVRGQMDAPVVTAALEGAFPLLPLPSMSPRQAQLADQSMSRRITKEEWVAAGTLDAGRTWQEFTVEELIQCQSALSHFDEESFVYYLPAYLRYAVRYCNVDVLHPTSELMGSAVFSVTDDSPHSLRRYKRLSTPQRAAVVCFLEFMSEHAEAFIASLAQKSLVRYWNNDERDKPLVIVP